MLLEDIADDTFNYEKMLRNIATNIQLGKYRDSTNYMYDLEEISTSILGLADETEKFAKDMAEAGKKDLAEKFARLSKALEHAHNALKKIYYYLSPFEVNPEITNEEVEEEMNRLEEEVKNITGKSCRYGISNRVTGLLNDIASCIHRVAENISEMFSEKIGKCIITKDGPGTKFCIEWDKVTSKAENPEDTYRLYEEEDENALTGWVVGDMVYLRVGSSEGHRTLVDLGEGKLHYYDTDKEVNLAVKKLLEDWAGLKCRIVEKNGFSEGVVCTGINENNMKRVAEALAMPTSMDYRIKSPEYYWSEEYLAIGEASMDEEWLRRNITR